MKITEKFCKENGFKREWLDETDIREGHYWELELYKDKVEGIMSITFDVAESICFLDPYDGIRFTTQKQVLDFLRAFPKCEHENISRDGLECLDCFKTLDE